MMLFFNFVFSFETTLSAWSNKAVITLCFANVGLCDVYCSGTTGLYALVFCRFLPRWFCRDFVGLRCQGMDDTAKRGG